MTVSSSDTPGARATMHLEALARHRCQNALGIGWQSICSVSSWVSKRCFASLRSLDKDPEDFFLLCHLSCRFIRSRACFSLRCSFGLRVVSPDFGVRKRTKAIKFGETPAVKPGPGVQRPGAPAGKSVFLSGSCREASVGSRQ